MSTCKGCGAPITWAKTKDGKNIPLNRITGNAYELDRVVVDDPEYSFNRRFEFAALKIERDIYVSHFLLCPKANDFSKGKKTKPTERGSM